MKNKEECSARGKGVWKNRMYNFDNLLNVSIHLNHSYFFGISVPHE